MKRCIVIQHPDFDGGAEGIKAAEQLAKGLLEAVPFMVEQVLEANPDKAHTKADLEAQAAKYKIVIRKLEV